MRLSINLCKPHVCRCKSQVDTYSLTCKLASGCKARHQSLNEVASTWEFYFCWHSSYEGEDWRLVWQEATAKTFRWYEPCSVAVQQAADVGHTNWLLCQLYFMFSGELYSIIMWPLTFVLWVLSRTTCHTVNPSTNFQCPIHSSFITHDSST